MTYLQFSPCSFENGRIDHFMDLLNDLRGGVNYKVREYAFDHILLAEDK